MKKWRPLAMVNGQPPKVIKRMTNIVGKNWTAKVKKMRSNRMVNVRTNNLRLLRSKNVAKSWTKSVIDNT
jgi:hypothetical protein